MEPLAHRCRVAGILEGEIARLALQHLADADGGGLCFLGTVTAGAIADVEIVLTHASIEAHQRAGRRGAPPGLVHSQDHTVWTDQRDMGRQRVQDGGLRFRGQALRLLAGAQLFPGFEQERHLWIDDGSSRNSQLFCSAHPVTGTPASSAV